MFMKADTSAGAPQAAAETSLPVGHMEKDGLLHLAVRYGVSSDEASRVAARLRGTAESDAERIERLALAIAGGEYGSVDPQALADRMLDDTGRAAPFASPAQQQAVSAALAADDGEECWDDLAVEAEEVTGSCR